MINGDMPTTKKSYIFGIGMSKTGTSSLSSALRDLGILCKHSHKEVLAAEEANRDTDRPLLYPLDQKVTAFCDSPIDRMFRELDVDYPGSKFILTVRAMTPWIISSVCHHGFSVAYLRQAWADHVNAVMDHFSARKSDLLVYDLCGGDGWEPLCDFLGVPVPDTEFPWRNKTSDARCERTVEKISDQL